uniref:Uncharacterized protein n=1 Tax=Fagus sylvatica TaxID=28930 RepID=A0A2N9GA48_FAGSY
MGMRKPSVIGEFMVLLFLRSTFDRQKLPKHQISENPKPRPVGFFWVTIWFLSHWPSLFLSSLSLAAMAGPHMASHRPKASTATRSHSLAVGLWLIDED